MHAKQTLCIPRFCTSIVAQDKNGHVYHGRNLDYPHPVLTNLTVNVIFLKNGEVQYVFQTFKNLIAGNWTSSIYTWKHSYEFFLCRIPYQSRTLAGAQWKFLRGDLMSRRQHDFFLLKPPFRWRTAGLLLLAMLDCGRDRVPTSLLSLATSEVRLQFLSAVIFVQKGCNSQILMFCFVSMSFLWSSGSEHLWNWWKNVVSAFLFHRSPVSWLVREVSMSRHLV